jgi:hypothetical protein
METLYNRNKILPAEHSLKGNIVPDAKRSENFTSLPWRAQSDSLWGHLPYSSVLQKTEIKMVFAKTSLFPSRFQLLSSLNNPTSISLRKRWTASYKKSNKGAIINFHHFAKFLKNGMSESSYFKSLFNLRN